MNLPSRLCGGLGVDYILHSCMWGGLGVDYIFAFWSMGWIRGGLHFYILVCGVD